MMWHEKTWEQVAEEFDTHHSKGLSHKQAEDKLSKYGANKLDEKKKESIFSKFFAQLNDFMVIILLIAAVVSLFITYFEKSSDYADPIIILSIVILNAILGLVQESKAEKSLEALKKMSASETKIIRDGRIQNISTELLIPGDIILLETGDYIPADARVVSSHNLRVEEASLTGESEAVEKYADVVLEGKIPLGDRSNMVFSSSIVAYGRGTAIVVETGMNTEVGKIATMIMEDDAPETPLQKKLAQTGKFLGIGALVICGLIFVMGVIRKVPPFEMFMTSVSLAVAAIPEGLPAIVTIMLAIGVQRMAGKNAVIRKLPAVETLGSATVICSDKTGTLTENKMEVMEISDGFDKLGVMDKQRNQILHIGAVCCDCKIQDEEDYEILGNPTEAAIVREALLSGIQIETIDIKEQRVGEVPFESKRKLMTVIYENNIGFRNNENKYLVITKGAPDILLEKCKYYLRDGKVERLNENLRKKILNTNNHMAGNALRIIGVAFNETSSLPSVIDNSIEKDLVFTGLIGIMDPPREEALGAVMTCIKAGIKPVMVTGDHGVTAAAIAEKVGIMKKGDKIALGEDLDRLTQNELEQSIFDYSVFARVTPEHKMRIVKAFQANGGVVAMTGDGVNDAPALKVADIGCAMGITGSDAAKGAADMVLTDDNFATIVDAVKEGRGIYSNIKKSVHFLLSSNIGEILTIFLAILLGWNSPLLAIHLLWVNLVTDSLPAIALGLDPAGKDIMEKESEKGSKSLFSGGLWQRIITEGIMIGFLALIAFGVGTLYFGGENPIGTGRTMAFATLSISQLFHAFNMRSDGSVFKINIFSNKYLVGAFIIGVILQVSVIMFSPLAFIFKTIPLNGIQWGLVGLLSVMPLVIVELEKMVSFQRNIPVVKEIKG